MTITPNTAELYSSHIPALATLVSLGWDYLSPEDCLAARGGNQGVVLRDVLVEQLRRRTFDYKGRTYPLSTNAIDQIVRELTSPALNEGLITANEKLYNAITLGITVTEFVEGKKHSVTVPIIDWAHPLANSFVASEEMEVLAVPGTHTRRPDIVGFVNGIPLLVIEAKRPDSGNPNKSMVDEGISQTIRNQGQEEIPHLFAYAHLLLSIGMTDGRYGTTKTPRKFWAQWREEEFSEDHFRQIKNAAKATDPRAAILKNHVREVRDHFQHLWSDEQAVTAQDRLLIGLCTPERLLEFVRSYVLFDRKVDKIVARHQQFFGIRALLNQISGIRPDGAREGGVIWHTTGSGKSFTMVMLCKALLLHEQLKACRLVVVTDRRDLEKQLAGNFLTGGAFGSDIGSKVAGKAKAQSGRDLAKRIGKGTERIIFTIINKFGSAARHAECRNDSADMIVLVDEGHRSQGGENHERMRKALPNAAYVAFTGTPLLKDDKTANKFGRIVHAYTMKDAVSDGTVTPLLYEEREPILDVNERAIDNWFDKVTAGLSDEQRGDLKKKFGTKGAVYGSGDRINLIALDIATHFSENFKDLDLGLKGQLATDSKRSAIRYKKALDATGLVSSAIVISPPDTREGHSEVDEAELPEVLQWWKENVKGDPDDYERQVIEDFSTDGRPDILIVVDKLLTGFDEPRNAVLYIDKKLEQHNLIQAIARVNRLHEHKKYGLLIDYRGILKALDTALTEYQDLAERTQGGFDLDDIDELYADVSTEYKRLPSLHADLWSIFKPVKNRADIEQYRQLLVPQTREGEDGAPVDMNQKIREDFYEALTAYGMCLKIALGSRSFFEDTSITEGQIAEYKRDLKFFSNLRKIVKQDAQETIDYSAYEDQIRRLVDRYVVGEDVENVDGVLIVNELGNQQAAETWSPEKTRNETDIIRSRVRKTIEQELADDPYAQLFFSDLLKRAIAEASALFDHPYKQYIMFKDLEEKLAAKKIDDLPKRLEGHRHASAYFGIIRLEIGDAVANGDEQQDFIRAALDMEKSVESAIAENSLNPANIEAAIRKALLPRLFGLTGLDKAKVITEKVVEVTRIGLARGSGAKA
ncbi:type I restriction endonuclease subunit R [Parerythrobacter aestuarii]|uniref:type I restriction endonuclease subunit R n=1 Tax=Parerythrobacter aestuarii TaxID=3020909 RepID=UPI0024DE3E47|nr:HsdR family type I site-specific deoxyribonuclease [Parerythrobacter aestuarii]